MNEVKFSIVCLLLTWVFLSAAIPVDSNEKDFSKLDLAQDFLSSGKPVEWKDQLVENLEANELNPNSNDFMDLHQPSSRKLGDTNPVAEKDEEYMRMEGSGLDLDGSGISTGKDSEKENSIVTIPLENDIFDHLNQNSMTGFSYPPAEQLKIPPGTIYGLNGYGTTGKVDQENDIITIWLDLKTGKIVGSTLASLDQALLSFIGKEKMESILQRVGK